MTWKGIWEGIASLFENVLFLPLDAIRTFQDTSWWGANLISWVFILIGAAAFIYWLGKLKEFNESTEETYTFDENP